MIEIAVYHSTVKECLSTDDHTIVSCGVDSAPIFFKFSVTVSIRFVSLTFSSAASRMIVVPSAQAARTAIIGISSMSVGIWDLE